MKETKQRCEFWQANPTLSKRQIWDCATGRTIYTPETNLAWIKWIGNQRFYALEIETIEEGRKEGKK